MYLLFNWKKKMMTTFSHYLARSKQNINNKTTEHGSTSRSESLTLGRLRNWMLDSVAVADSALPAGFLSSVIIVYLHAFLIKLSVMVGKMPAMSPLSIPGPLCSITAPLHPSPYIFPASVWPPAPQARTSGL